MIRLFGWVLHITPHIDQPSDHMDTWFGIGGFKYDYRGGKGYYLFLYYGSKYVNINLHRDSK